MSAGARLAALAFAFVIALGASVAGAAPIVIEMESVGYVEGDSPPLPISISLAVTAGVIISATDVVFGGPLTGTVSIVPEPSTALLLGMALAGLAAPPASSADRLPALTRALCRPDRRADARRVKTKAPRHRGAGALRAHSRRATWPGRRIRRRSRSSRSWCRCRRC